MFETVTATTAGHALAGDAHRGPPPSVPIPGEADEATAVRIAVHADIGPRENLEDSASAFVFRNAYPRGREIPVMAVFDGVGGHQGGREASRLAAKLAGASLGATLGGLGGEVRSPDAILSLLVEPLQLANDAIADRADRVAGLEGMATTAVCAIVLEGVLYVVWAGDSRCYVCGADAIRQITRDHSKVQELIDAGSVTAQAADRHAWSHVITNCLGQPRGCVAAVREYRLKPDDVVVLCTDGLTDAVSDSQIADLVRATTGGLFEFEELPKRLVDLALERGTQDNVTVLCCQVSDEIVRAPDRTLTGAYGEELMRHISNKVKEEHDV